MKHTFEYLERECKILFIKQISKIIASFFGVVIIGVAIFQIIPKKQKEERVAIIEETPKSFSKKDILKGKEISKDDLIIDKKFEKNPIFTKKEIKSRKREEEIALQLKTNINLKDAEKIYKEREKELARRREIEAKKRVLNKKISPTKEKFVYKPNNNNQIQNRINNNSSNASFTPVKFEVKEYKGIESLKERYFKSPSYEIAIKLANDYMKKRDYQNAVEWALKASRLNTKSIEPWLIYAKSKYNLGQKERAIKVLELLNSKKSSKRVQELLISLKKSSI